MNPWTVIGWLVLSAIATVMLIVLVAVVAGVWKGLKHYHWHLRTRKTPPAAGQEWLSSKGDLYCITLIQDNGVLGIRCGNASWGETAAEWAARVEDRTLALDESLPKVRRTA